MYLQKFPLPLVSATTASIVIESGNNPPTRPIFALLVLLLMLVANRAHTLQGTLKRVIDCKRLFLLDLLVADATYDGGRAPHNPPWRRVATTWLRLATC